MAAVSIDLKEKTCTKKEVINLYRAGFTEQQVIAIGQFIAMMFNIHANIHNPGYIAELKYEERDNG